MALCPRTLHDIKRLRRENERFAEMSRHHSTPRVDANQTDIVDGLRAHGASVESLAGLGKGVPDLLVAYMGKTYLVAIQST